MNAIPADKIRVLFVDDEEEFLDLAEKFYENEGKIELDVTPSAKKALDLLEVGDYDAVVSDYKMPEMNGLELLEKLRARGNDTPFIILTGRGEEEVAMNALNKGADRYHRKGKKLKTQFSKLTKSIVEEVVRKKSEAELKTFQKWVKNVLSSESDEWRDF